MIDARDRLLLEDMMTFSTEAQDFLGGGDAALLDADKMRLYAVIRALELVGEAASKVDASVRQAHPQIPWRQVIDMRNLLIHGYGRVRSSIVATTVHTHLPPLVAALKSVLGKQTS